MPHVNLPQHRIGLAHSLQNGDRPDPEPTARPIPHNVARLNARLTETRIVTQHQFAIAAENLVRAIGGLVDHDFSRVCSAVMALHHRCVDAESARQHRRREDQHRDDQADHAGPPAKLRKFATPEHRATRDCDSDEADRVCHGTGE